MAVLLTVWRYLYSENIYLVKTLRLIPCGKSSSVFVGLHQHEVRLQQEGASWPLLSQVGFSGSSDVGGYISQLKQVVRHTWTLNCTYSPQERWNKVIHINGNWPQEPKKVKAQRSIGHLLCIYWITTANLCSGYLSVLVSRASAAMVLEDNEGDCVFEPQITVSIPSHRAVNLKLVLVIELVVFHGVRICIWG